VGMGTPCSMPPGGTAACYDGDQGLTCTYLCDTAPCPGGIPCTFSTYCSYVP
jgi:hypothetical protein